MKNISELSVSVKSVNAQAEKALTEKEQASQKLKADQIVIKNLTAKRDAIEKENSESYNMKLKLLNKETSMLKRKKRLR